MAVVLAFIVLRLPMMYRVWADEDEHCYAAPGLTILESGIPRLPHVPARNLDSVYYHADEALFAEPPLYFYWQAAFYAVFPKTLGTARLSSAVAGVLLLWCLYRIALRSGVTPIAAAIACAALSLSRWFYLPAARARPDVLCALFGLMALLATWRWSERRRSGDLLLAGFLIGLGGLTHPIALVYAVQIAAWIALESRGSLRITNPLLVAAAAIATASLWVPMIVAWPEAFRIQFGNQFLGSSNGSVLRNLVWPWPSLAYHAESVVWYLGPIQCGLLAATTAIGLVATFRSTSPLRVVLWLSITGFVLTAVLVGPHHRVYGYFVLPAALAFVLIGRGVDLLAAWAAARGFSMRATRLGVAMVLAGVLLPGSGLRMLVILGRHWNDVNYNTPAFCRLLMEAIPPDAVPIVDEPFVIEFLANGRKAILAQTVPFYFRAQDFDSDDLVLGRHANREVLLEHAPADVVQTFGDRDDPFACWAEIDRRK